MSCCCNLRIVQAGGGAPIVDTSLYIGNGAIPAGTRTVSFDPLGDLLFDNIAAGPVVISGKLTVGGMIDPVGVQFTESNCPSVGPPGPGKGTIYVSDGSDGVTANRPAYQDGVGTCTEIALVGGTDTHFFNSNLVQAPATANLHTLGAGGSWRITGGNGVLQQTDPGYQYNHNNAGNGANGGIQLLEVGAEMQFSAAAGSTANGLSIATLNSSVGWGVDTQVDVSWCSANNNYGFRNAIGTCLPTGPLPAGFEVLAVDPADGRIYRDTTGLVGGAGSPNLFDASDVLTASVTHVINDGTQFLISDGTDLFFQLDNTSALNPQIELSSGTSGLTVGGGASEGVRINDNRATGTTFTGTGAKVATFNGDIDVTGLIDPTGLQLTPVAANPGDVNTIWVNSADGHAYRGPVDLELTGGGGGSIYAADGALAGNRVMDGASFQLNLGHAGSTLNGFEVWSVAAPMLLYHQGGEFRTLGNTGGVGTPTCEHRARTTAGYFGGLYNFAETYIDDATGQFAICGVTGQSGSDPYGAYMVANNNAGAESRFRVRPQEIRMDFDPTAPLVVGGLPGTPGDQITSNGPGVPPVWGPPASDIAVKNSLVDMVDYGLETIMSLVPKRFKYNGEEVDRIGFVAQDVQQVIPEAVALRSDDLLGLRKDDIVAVLVNAVKELKAQVDELSRR